MHDLILRNTCYRPLNPNKIVKAGLLRYFQRSRPASTASSRVDALDGGRRRRGARDLTPLHSVSVRRGAMLTETRAHDNGAAAGPGPGSSAGFQRGIVVSDRSVLEMSVAERTRLVHHVHERWETIAHAVPHVKQTYNWDCGLACVLMVVRALGASAHHCDLRTLRQLCRTTSIWTVDLAYLLRRFGADVTFTTVTMGANPAYESESFYRDNLREDCERVDALFKGARANGISIERKSLSLDAIKAYAGDGEYLVILLVDKPKLGVKPRDAMVLPEGENNGRGGSDRFGWLTGAAGKPAAWGARRGSESASTFANGTAPSRGYTGHYIVVCGYNPVDGEFLCRDPASHVRDLIITAENLEKARRAFGTDEDILLVRNEALDQREVLAASREADPAAEGAAGPLA